MNISSSSSMLVAPMAKQKLLTVKFPEQTLAEFHAAAEILGARTLSALVHQFAMQKIREAKGMVSGDEFANAVNEKFSEMSARSKEKSESRSNGIINIPDRSSDNASLNFSGENGAKDISKEAKLDALIDKEIEKKKRRKLPK